MSLLKKILKWTGIGVLALLVFIVIGGRTYQIVAESRDLERFPPSGRMIEVDGTAMHIHCYGEGSPTVVFEQGLGGLNETWEHIFEPIADVTRICYYDRVGMGYSDPIDYGIEAPEVARRLHQLLTGADENEALILLGWSAGGVYIREYFKQFPGNVRGMVLVDSSHEQQQLRFPPSEGGGNNLLQIANYLAPFGILRAFGLVERETLYLEMSDELRARVVARYSTSHAIKTQLDASDSFNADTTREEPPTTLGDLPLIVLTQGRPIEPPEGEEPSEALLNQRRIREVWNELQIELAALSTSSRHIIATESGHSIHLDQPELLIQAIKDMISTVRGS